MRLKRLSFFLIIIMFYMFSGESIYGAKIVTIGYYIPDVPFVIQKPYWCGPACLSMVLQYWGVNVSQGEIAAEIYDPETHINFAYRCIIRIYFLNQRSLFRNYLSDNFQCKP